MALYFSTFTTSATFSSVLSSKVAPKMSASFRPKASAASLHLRSFTKKSVRFCRSALRPNSMTRKRIASHSKMRCTPM